jgi:hypothetical protein
MHAAASRIVGAKLAAARAGHWPKKRCAACLQWHGIGLERA